jgi:hypothetical protein
MQVFFLIFLIFIFRRHNPLVFKDKNGEKFCFFEVIVRKST